MYGDGMRKFTIMQTIVDEIKKIDFQLESYSDFFDRVERITSEYSKTIMIQIGEEFHGTPRIEVNLEDLLEFVKSQRNILSKKKDKLNEELDSY